MSAQEIFDSCVRRGGDLAGVFEYDGETGYFYLYKREGDEGEKVLASIHILSGEPGFVETDVSIRWDVEDAKVGLFIKDVLWAVFVCHEREEYSGNYRPGVKPSLRR